MVSLSYNIPIWILTEPALQEKLPEPPPAVLQPLSPASPLSNLSPEPQNDMRSPESAVSPSSPTAGQLNVCSRTNFNIILDVIRSMPALGLAGERRQHDFILRSYCWKYANK